MLLQKVDDASIRSLDDFSEGAMDLLIISAYSESIVSNAATERFESSIIFVAYDCKSSEYFSAKGMFSSRTFTAASGTGSFSIAIARVSAGASLGGEKYKSDLKRKWGEFAIFWKALAGQTSILIEMK